MKEKISNFLRENKKIILIVAAIIAAFLVVFFIYRSVGVSTMDALMDGIDTPSGKTIERIAGSDRYSTAVGISKRQFMNTSGGYVFIVSGESWPDAAPTGVLARAYNGPILLTTKDVLNSYTANEITRIKPSNVVIIGGTGAISDVVKTKIAQIVPNAKIERIAGYNRYDTAAKIADRVALKLGSIPDKSAFVVTSENFPDVLTVGPVAAKKGYPILYASSMLPAETSSILAKLGITKTIVVGGTAAVTDQTMNKLPSPIRISGIDRYQTSVNFASYAYRSLGFSKTNIGVASGENYPDALAASQYLGSLASPAALVLSPYGSNATVNNYLASIKSSINRIYVFGGTSVISTTEYMNLANFLGYGFTAQQIQAQGIVDTGVQYCPILAGTTADFGYAQGYQAVAYYKSGRIVISPSHTASLTTIVRHEIYHILDWRDNGRIDWGENVPLSSPKCY